MTDIPDQWCYLNRGLRLQADGTGLRVSDAAHALQLPPSSPARLGDRRFLQEMGIDLPYLCGAMADGISSVELVVAIGSAGMMGFFGAAGLELVAIEDALVALKAAAQQRRCRFGCNLIHSPFDRQLEEQTVELYLRHGIDIIEASAFMDVTLPLVRYRVAGVQRNHRGEIVVPNRVIAKVSREELVSKFFSPPPVELLTALQEKGLIDAQQAQLAAQLPMADSVTAEADSGGHTDKRALVSILPTFLSLRDRLAARYPQRHLYVGAAGGIADPRSALAAFSMGAAYVVSGSINQCCVEANTSTTVKELLAQAQPADVMMAPAADMFEMGIQVQVLKRGTMFPMRARHLYQLYRNYDSIASLPATEQANLERNFFAASLDHVWRDTAAYFEQRDPQQLVRAAQDPKHRMALLFRTYLGRSSPWARKDDREHCLDFQIWCGAAMGNFNAWVKDSCLDPLPQRKVAVVALNILFGAALLARLHLLRMQTEIALPDLQLRPCSLADIEKFLQ